jgi:hypothetical protein
MSPPERAMQKLLAPQIRPPQLSDHGHHGDAEWILRDLVPHALLLIACPIQALHHTLEVRWLHSSAVFR